MRSWPHIIIFAFIYFCSSLNHILSPLTFKVCKFCIKLYILYLIICFISYSNFLLPLFSVTLARWRVFHFLCFASAVNKYNLYLYTLFFIFSTKCVKKYLSIYSTNTCCCIKYYYFSHLIVLTYKCHANFRPRRLHLRWSPFTLL